MSIYDLRFREESGQDHLFRISAPDFRSAETLCRAHLLTEVRLSLRSVNACQVDSIEHMDPDNPPPPLEETHLYRRSGELRGAQYRVR